LASLYETELIYIPQNVHFAEILSSLATEAVNDAISLSEKADRILFEWQQRYNPTEPVLTNLEDCVELFRQGQQIRFPDDLFERADEHYYPEQRKSAPRCGSAIKEVTTEQMLDAMPTIEQIQELAHSENIDEWIETVRLTLTHRMSLAALVEKSGLAIVPLWIALLFGRFTIEREGDFYEGTIIVSVVNQNPEYNQAS